MKKTMPFHLSQQTNGFQQLNKFELFRIQWNIPNGLLWCRSSKCFIIRLTTWMPCRWSPSETWGPTLLLPEPRPPLTASPDTSWSGCWPRSGSTRRTAASRTGWTPSWSCRWRTGSSREPSSKGRWLSSWQSAKDVTLLKLYKHCEWMIKEQKCEDDTENIELG